MSNPTFSGPLAIVVIPGIDDVSLAPGATTGEVTYRWSRSMKLRFLGFMPVVVSAGNLVAVAPYLELAMRDEKRDLATDGQGLSTSARFVPSLAIAGGLNGSGVYTPRWHALSLDVDSGEQWRFEVRNLAASPATVRTHVAFKVEYK